MRKSLLLKKITLIGLLAIIPIMLFSQKYDLVITVSGDSIACHIDSVTEDRIYFQMIENRLWTDTQLDLSAVTDYQESVPYIKRSMFSPGTSIIEKEARSRKPPTEIKKNFINANLLGPFPFVAVSYERIIRNNLGLEAGIGTVGTGGGIRFYPVGIKPKKAILHLGLSGFYVFGDWPIWTRGYGYGAIGVSVFGAWGFRFSADLGPIIFEGGGVLPYAGIKLGYGL